MTETAPLIELVHQVDESKLLHNVSNKMAARFLGLIQVQVDTSLQYGVLELEALQGLL